MVLALTAPSRSTGAIGQPTLVVGAKKFTEGAILGELMAQALEQHADAKVERRFNLAGTKVAFDALRTGAIDAYAEYSGTGLREVLGDMLAVSSAAEAFARVSRGFDQRYGLAWLAPFGFNNTYVLIMRAEQARALKIVNVSDAAVHPLRYGMSHEFLQREDGMPGLLRAYGLQTESLVGMEHDLAYQALADGAIDVSDGYSTDAKIVAGNLIALRDDKDFFPPYEAAPLVRRDLFARVPAAAAALALLAGRIDDATMRRLNHQVEFERREPADVAAGFLHELGLGAQRDRPEVREHSLLALLWQRRAVTLALAGWHLLLTGVAVALACVVAMPLGIGASRRPRLASAALGTAGVLQTIPSIALLAFMLPLFGIGARPAIMALFLYGLLPVLRNTVTGLRGVDPKLIEVGLGLGMRPRQLLWQVELPLAAPVIFAGVRTSTVINIGTATLAAFIGAGGLGDPI
ncbi:MAG TPA: glycine betaine ABC transporter substrate-binding protein, partial [Candidatus Kryptonia bacterium]|nr:glycine betaine ABC transporter substrate-binding protein [Candidatus Kryptonia bacterium]